MKVIRPQSFDPKSNELLEINCALVERWLVSFLREECKTQRGINRAILGLSGGVDSAVTAYLAARAFGPENVTAIRMPYKLSSQESLDHAQLIADKLGLNLETVSISKMVDGYCENEINISPLRLGNVCARCRMTVLYDWASKLNGLPIGTSNKTERMFGYFTWHADDSPAINPLGDLLKTQIWQLARHLQVPNVVVDKAPTADLIEGQTDEGDWGISIPDADRILAHLLRGANQNQVISLGFDSKKVQLVCSKVAKTHWKRHLPTQAMLTDSAINEFYLRPVDYRQ